VPDLELRHHDGTAARAVLGELLDVYRVVYGVAPYLGDPFFSVEAFADRLTTATELAGFEAVTAHAGAETIGLAHGVTLPPDRSWWLDLADARPPAARAAAQAHDVFWLRELMVLPSRTGRGAGRALHDALVTARPEHWTALTCIHDNEPARSTYPRWGYQAIGPRIRHAPDSPEYDALLLAPGALRTRAAHRPTSPLRPHRAEHRPQTRPPAG
jgi:GNAT superfamily N-acetyltransferase